jgi:hypothetical protein
VGPVARGARVRIGTAGQVGGCGGDGAWCHARSVAGDVDQLWAGSVVGADPTGGQADRGACTRFRVREVSSRPVVLWRSENESIFSQTVAAAASKLNISELAVAKDYWVCEALRAVISHAGNDLVFKGGTSLEKMRLVQRFSEDLDLLVTGRYGNKRATERALKRMCEAAAGAIPGAVAFKPENGSGGEKGAEGADDSFWRKVYIEVPLAEELETMGIADPTRIMLELVQAGGPTPTQVMPVTSLLGRELASAGVPIAEYPDLASFEVRMLHPGRTLIEKLLRMNNFLARTRGGRGEVDGWSRIGRQLYDVWALLGGQDHPHFTEIDFRFGSGSVFLRDEYFDSASGFDVDLRSPDPHVVAHRRIRKVLRSMFIGKSGEDSAGRVPLFSWCVDISGEHGVDRSFERIELRGAAHRDLPRRRLRLRQRHPHRCPADLVAAGQLPDRALLDPGVTSNAGEQLHPSLHHCPPPVAGIRKAR